jgi:Flp pilus assembly protein TadG
MFELLRRLAGCTSGAAMVEATIVTPVAISLLVGGVEFGSLFLHYGTANKSVRDAARYLARAPQATICAGGTGRTVATNLAIYGSAINTGIALIGTPTDWTISFDADCANPTYVTVTAAVTYTPIMFRGIPFTSISFARNATVTHTELYLGNIPL